MKKLGLLFFLLPLFSFAQRDKNPGDLPWIKTDSGAVRVILPDLNYLDWAKINTTSRSDNTISADSMYHKLFSRFAKDSLPSFDFAKQELYTKSYCMQCISSCPPINGHIEPCHRNACRYTAVWFVRNKRNL